MNNRTVYFFKELSKIPRESGNESEVSNYICNFAEKRGLDYKQDKYGKQQRSGVSAKMEKSKARKGDVKHFRVRS